MTLFGVDLSNYQAGIDLAQIRREGFDFALCKVSQGTGYVSPDWARQRDAAREAGLLLAGYHYIDGEDARGQAAHCRAALGEDDIPVALDLEKGGGDLANFRRVLDEFTRAGIRVPLSYIPRWYWAEIGAGELAGLPPLWASRYPSMAEDYASSLYQAVDAAGGPLGKYWAGYGGGVVRVLQFACTAKVAGRVVDANAFLGTRGELAALLGSPASPGPSPAAPEEDPVTVWAHDIPDRYGPNLPPMDAGAALSWATAHAAHARDAARRGTDAAIRAEATGLKSLDALGELAAKLDDLIDRAPAEGAPAHPDDPALDLAGIVARLTDLDTRLRALELPQETP